MIIYYLFQMKVGHCLVSWWYVTLYYNSVKAPRGLALAVCCFIIVRSKIHIGQKSIHEFHSINVPPLGFRTSDIEFKKFYEVCDSIIYVAMDPHLWLIRISDP